MAYRDVYLLDSFEYRDYTYCVVDDRKNYKVSYVIPYSGAIPAFWKRSAAIIKVYRRIKNPIVQNWYRYYQESPARNKILLAPGLDGGSIDAWYKTAFPDETDFPELIACLRKKIENEKS